ncbi:lysophospholipid acyltransferase family protein [Phaeovulum sp.]|uniref:lysophospholipid acyltransferase family protein n=1 Tax=Phaeovulum sp. TaxID=2934796 RepID=UPI0039E3F3E9
MTTWRDGEPAPGPRPGPLGVGLGVLRGGALLCVTYGGLLALLALRLVERPVHGDNRPWTPHITQAVCRTSFRIMGIGYHIIGQPIDNIGAVVANHGSWLDIFALNACQRVYFVSKAEVADWPVIGWLARATGTVFIRRNRNDAKAQQALLGTRIRAGHRLLFFPEGTSTDGLRVQPFKSTLFAPFYDQGVAQDFRIQPITVIYRAPEGADARFYGWWGDMAFGSHFMKVLVTPRQGSVEVVFHAPVLVRDFLSRKDLTAYCEAQVRAALPYDATSLDL